MLPASLHRKPVDYNKLTWVRRESFKKTERQLVLAGGDSDSYSDTSSIRSARSNSIMSVDSEVEVTVIILEARGVASKKKGKGGRYSVIFGVGSKKFRTDVVEDQTGNPKWYQESVITVTKNVHPLKIVLTDKDTILGQVVVSLDELPMMRCEKQIAPLREHKKCSHPKGELVFEVWLSKGVFAQLPAGKKRFSLSTTNLAGKLKEKVLSSDTLSKFKHRGSLGSLSNLNIRRGSKSQSDLTAGSLSLYRNDSLLSVNDDYNSDLASSRTDSVSQYSEPPAIDMITEPVITEISPPSGPTGGHTRLTIYGDNLGECKEDVIGLFVCGSNVLGSIEYESSYKIYCTTKPWRSGTGDVIVVTQSGGKGGKNAQFTFQDIIPEIMDSVPDKGTSNVRSGSDPPIINQNKLNINNNIPKAMSSDNLHDLPLSKQNGSVLPVAESVKTHARAASHGDIKVDNRTKSMSLDFRSNKHEEMNNHNGSLPTGYSTLDSRTKNSGLKPSIIINSDASEYDESDRSVSPSPQNLDFKDKKKGILSWTKKDKPKGVLKKSVSVDLTNCAEKGISQSDLLAEIMRLKGENDGLRTENRCLLEQNSTMKGYIDDLLMKVLDKCPAILMKTNGHHRPRPRTNVEHKF